MAEHQQAMWDIFCVVANNHVPFPITIQSSKTVGILRRAIFDEVPHRFTNLDVIDLTLYLVNIPDDDNLVSNLQSITLPAPLKSTEELSQAFEDSLEKRTVHILVKVPEIPDLLPNQDSTPMVRDGSSGSVQPDPNQPPAGMSLTSAKNLHKKLWGKPLASLFEVITVKDTRFFYLSKEVIKDLELRRLGFRPTVLLVRKEYELAFEEFEKTWEAQSQTEYWSGGVVLTGQPGIGKTCFLFYALLRRISEGRPTALQTIAASFLLFTETGAKRYSASDAEAMPFGVWALADSNASISRPCDAFIGSSSESAWVVQATSPKLERWKEWSKQLSALSYVMDAVTIEELQALGELLGLPVNKLTHLYKKWGPSARVCIDLANPAHPELDGMMESRVALNATKLVQSAKVVIPALESLDPDFTHSLFTVRPTPGNRREAEVEISSPFIRDLVLHEAAKIEAAKQVELFTTMAVHPMTRGPAGWLFEKLVHTKFCGGSNSLPSKATPKVRGHEPLQIRVPSRMLFGAKALTDAKKAAGAFYWRPSTDNFPSIDSAICTLTEFIMIQITISPTHDVSPVGLDKIKTSTRGWIDRLKWRFVFITNNEENATSLRNQPLEILTTKGISIYSYVYPLDGGGLTSALLKRITATGFEDQRPQEMPPSGGSGDNMDMS